ncbi:ABC transporter permease subunit [candidate division KSB3 bacterium]|uniref:ABC transporter permease subunit n=1 Tax=candidate division KSB3 bacterium TaxID=2044937 RepID=A0A9D5K0U7_9BACT|nr:ABC transporter permease subunit [candidate division KSB3 bacterium]MBD3327576.1 ABC transporter permease subunit [candidate division KSB3 bacterium]
MKYKKFIPITLLTLGALLILLPIFWTFTTSFKTPPEITKVPPTILPDSFANVSNYTQVFTQLKFGRLLLNTFLMCLVVVVCSLIFASLAGYGFAKFTFIGKEYFFYGIVAILMIPFQSVAVPLFHWMDRLGLIDTFPGLVLPLLVSAFGVLLMREAFSTIPNDYIDAARIDGCSELRIFWSIALPMVRPSLAALAIIKFMWTWNEFFWPLLVITTPSKGVVTLGLASLSNMYFRQYWLITAAAVLSVLPLFVMFIFLRKWMVMALTEAGLKG